MKALAEFCCSFPAPFYTFSFLSIFTVSFRFPLPWPRLFFVSYHSFKTFSKVNPQINVFVTINQATFILNLVFVAAFGFEEFSPVLPVLLSGIAHVCVDCYPR